MFDNLFTTVLKWRWTWIAIALIGIGVYVYTLIQDNRELTAENATFKQNEVALQDELSKGKDSIQTLAVKVSNIQSSEKEWKNKYIAVNTKYQIALDSVRVYRAWASNVTVIGDSIGTVPFDTTQGIAHITGETTVNIKSKVGTYSVSVAFAEIEAGSVLFYDEVDKLWKMRTIALTPGVKLRGLSNVDDDTFRKIQGLKALEPPIPGTFGVSTLVAYDRVYGGVVFSPTQWAFTLYYKLFDKFGTTNDAVKDRIMVGVQYYIW